VVTRGLPRLGCCACYSEAGQEIVYLPQEETAAGSIAFKNKRGLLKARGKSGYGRHRPGLSLQEETVKLVKELATIIKVPLLIDGDGLTGNCGKSGNITPPGKQQQF